MQGWRALGYGKSGAEYVLFVGMSYEKIRVNYTNSFTELLTMDEKYDIYNIDIQRWSGAADQGKWVTQGKLKIPPVKESTCDLSK
jgi:hypothetical protein